MRFKDVDFIDRFYFFLWEGCNNQNRVREKFIKIRVLDVELGSMV